MADAMREFAETFEGHGGDAHKAFSRMLRSGTPAGKITSPGRRGHGTAFNEARGHPLADRLGGTHRDPGWKPCADP
ncbi:hypothetical protein ACWFRM_14750 [Streptomyces sp. NPDC055144]